MDSVTSKDVPPAYETLTPAASHRLLRQARRTVTEEREINDCNLVEATRLRNFLVFCLCIDYRHAVPTVLTPEDSQHFFQLEKTLSYLDAAYDRTMLAGRNRVETASYLWRYIYQPCKILRIPAESAVRAILRFAQYQNTFAQYKSCAFGLMHYDGPLRLAEKLWLDINVMIPHLLPVKEDQNSMIRRVNAIACLYFTEIDGIEGSIAPAADNTEYRQVQSVTYSLTARGEAYVSARKTCISAAHLGTMLSPAHVARRLAVFVPDIRLGRDVFKSAKTGQNRGDLAKPMRKYMPYPRLWLWNRTLHLPNLFEERQGKLNSDL